MESREWVRGRKGRKGERGREEGREEGKSGLALMIIKCIARVLSCCYIEKTSYHVLDSPWIAQQN